MYCGTEIPAELRLSEKQKQEIIEKRKEEENNKIHNAKSPNNGTGDSMLTAALIIGSGCVGGSGDCG